MRLTHKHKYKTDSKRYVFDMKDYIKACQKLGQLEDIEEELGIDLITFGKLVLNGCYVIDHWKCDDYEKTVISHFTFCRVFIRGFLARYNPDCEEHHFAFQDYGKTWALTKEELL